ncbi:putative glutaredoxin, Thioredoxin-like superfamily [Helianthus annuus]|nr:putative glutaredoxin, Thioredoxin-like superfamily [Helianthus annuus]
MWSYRRKNDNDNNSDNNDYSPKSRRPPSSPNFKRRTFKDIETLTHDNDMIEQQQQQQTSSSTQNTSTNATTTRPTVFHRVHLANRFTRAFAAKPKPEPGSVKPKKLEKLVPGSDKRVVVYLTSLRAVRSTFEACRTVRSILHGFRVPIDERDLLMDSSFFDEIRKIMAQIGQGRSDDKRVSLPKVFIGGRYIGGADEIVELHEIGELKKFMSGLPAVAPGVCEICGGFRFTLCEECNGSHKCPLEDGGFTTCVECNENGLIRCTSCLS